MDVMFAPSLPHVPLAMAADVHWDDALAQGDQIEFQRDHKSKD